MLTQDRDALGRVRAIHGRDALGHVQPIHGRFVGVKAKARASGFGGNTLMNRMRLHDCTVEEAIAMGPPDKGRAMREHQTAEMAWLVVEAEKLGINEWTVYWRLSQNWTVDRILFTPSAAPDRSGSGLGARSRAAGIPANVIRRRVKTHKCTIDEAIAMGPSGALTGRGIKRSPETRARMSAAAKLRWTKIKSEVEKESDLAKKEKDTGTVRSGVAIQSNAKRPRT